jgi:hypothetical protein
MPDLDLTIDQPTIRPGVPRRRSKLGRFHWWANQASVQFTGSNTPPHIGSSQSFLDYDPYNQDSIQLGRAFSISEQSSTRNPFQFRLRLEIRHHDSSDEASGLLRQRAASLNDDFRELATRWKKATSFHSSLARKFMHDDYQSILAMGEPVIPLLLSELKMAPDHWFWALKHIAREDPAKDASSVRDAVDAWLAWGRTKHYID